MKVGLITLSCAYNYGAVLQAYATERFLNQHGYDAVLIDYVTERYQIDTKDYVYKTTVRWKKNALTRFVWKYTWHKNDVKCRDFFRNFVEEHIPKTKVYYSNEELKEDLPDCDAFISGSDQIWNTDFSWDKQPDYPFFLDFVPDDRKKIAYSSSFGEVHMSTEVKQKVRKLLERYDAIAVRENSGKNLVEDGVLVVRAEPEQQFDLQRLIKIIFKLFPLGQPVRFVREERMIPLSFILLSLIRLRFWLHLNCVFSSTRIAVCTILCLRFWQSRRKVFDVD